MSSGGDTLTFTLQLTVWYYWESEKLMQIACFEHFILPYQEIRASPQPSSRLSLLHCSALSLMWISTAMDTHFFPQLSPSQIVTLVVFEDPFEQNSTMQSQRPSVLIYS